MLPANEKDMPSSELSKLLPLFMRGFQQPLLSMAAICVISRDTFVLKKKSRKEALFPGWKTKAMGFHDDGLR